MADKVSSTSNVAKPLKKRRQQEEGAHDIVITVIIAKATKEDPQVKNCSHGSTSKIYEAPKAQSYFHCSYKLLGDEKESVKTDVVTFGAAAKLYTDNDTRVLRTWSEDDKTWVAWKNSHNLHITKDLLLKMFNHSVVLKMWDTKDKVSAKARFDRPKGFRLPPLKGGHDEADIETIHSMISQADSLLSSAGSKHSGMLNVNCLRKDDSTGANLREQKSSSVVKELNKEVQRKMTGIFDYDEQNIIIKVPVDDKNRSPFHSLKQLASDGIKASIRKEEVAKRAENKEIKDTLKQRVESSGDAQISKKQRQEKSKHLTTTSSEGQRQESTRSSHSKQNGVANISIPLSSLFTGATTTTARLKYSTESIIDVIITLVLDAPLMSEPQRQQLNPMVIKVKSASKIPNRPMSYATIRERCLPPYITYQIFNLPCHKAVGSECNKKIYFNDSYVVLAGTINNEAIIEYLQGPKLAIALHDRDKNIKVMKQKVKLFGQLKSDCAIASVDNAANAIHSKLSSPSSAMLWNPHGVAHVDLSEFLLGETHLEFIEAVRACQSPGALLKRQLDVNLANGFEDSEISMADYLHAGTELRLSVSLAYPLVGRKEDIYHHLPITVADKCPFTRMVLVFPYDNHEFHHSILKQVMELNATALELLELPAGIVRAALSTYKLSDEQKQSKTLDIITGFQVIDAKQHILVLEARVFGGMKILWNKINDGRELENKTIRVLYDSTFHFERRIYDSLNVDLTRIKLESPLDTIVENPILHVRDMVERSCYDALIRIQELTTCQSIRVAVKNNLFPTCEMIVAIGSQFGRPLTEDDFERSTNTAAASSDSVEPTSQRGSQLNEHPMSRDRPWTPLNTANPQFESTLRLRSNGGVKSDFVALNADRIQDGYGHRQLQGKVTCDLDEFKQATAHNYSNQWLNSTEQAIGKLKEILAKDPEARYTYCQDYSAATLVPHQQSWSEQLRGNSSGRRQNKRAFSYPGIKSSIDSNKPLKQPDKARLDELKMPWRENVLHANILKPTVQRAEFNWKNRDMDFDTSSRRKQEKYPGTIHLAGDLLAAEQQEALMVEQQRWKEQLVVESTDFAVHRCGVKTENTERGPHSASQVTRQQDILKDKPQKYSLSAPGMVLKQIPTTSVTDKRETEQFTKEFCYSIYKQDEKSSGYHPGAFMHRSWLMERNRIPVKDN